MRIQCILSKQKLVITAPTIISVDARGVDCAIENTSRNVIFISRGGLPLNNGVIQLVVTCWHIMSNYNYTVKLYYFAVYTVQILKDDGAREGERGRNLFMKYVLN